MTPFNKLIPHAPKKGQYGDCYRTAIACLINVHPSSVPHTKGATLGMRDYLASKGFGLFEMPIYGPDIDDVLAEMRRSNPDVYYLLLGRTANGVGHCVVCLGGKVIHDPNPEQPGVVDGLDDEMFFVHVLVPLGMMAPTRSAKTAGASAPNGRQLTDKRSAATDNEQ